MTVFIKLHVFCIHIFFKGIPQGRWKVLALNLFEVWVKADLTSNGKQQDTEILKDRESIIELMMQYDFVIPLLQGKRFIQKTYSLILNGAERDFFTGIRMLYAYCHFF